MKKKSIDYNNYSIDYFHPSDDLLFTHIQLPDFLFENKDCQKLSTSAKLLYGMLLREVRKKGEKKPEVDDKGHMYIAFSIKETCAFLRCSESTAKRVRKELRDCFGKNRGLIELVSHGQGNCDYVYVMNFTPSVNTTDTQNDPSRNVKNELPSETSHELPSELNSDPYKSDPYIIYNNKGDLKKDNKYHLSNSEPASEKMDDDQHISPTPVSIAKDINAYATALEDFKAQIGFNQLLCYSPDKTALIDDITHIMAQEYVSCSEETIINGRHYTRAAIRDCLRSIDISTAKYTLDCLGRTNTKVKNIQRYILATLLNAPASFKAQKAYEDQVKQNRLLSHDRGPAYIKQPGKKAYEPYHGRDYSEEAICALERKKLGLPV